MLSARAPAGRHRFYFVHDRGGFPVTVPLEVDAEFIDGVPEAQAGLYRVGCGCGADGVVPVLVGLLALAAWRRGRAPLE